MSNERRKYYRTALVLPIEVYSYACEHSRFYEQTQTLNLSPLGASFRLQNRVDIDDIVRLILPMPPQLRLYDQDATQYQIYAQVRRVRNRGDGSISVGVAFISKDAPDIEINQPMYEREPDPEIRPQGAIQRELDPDDAFLTRPLGPQGLVKGSISPLNPLSTSQSSINVPSLGLQKNPPNVPNMSNPVSSPLAQNPATPPSVPLQPNAPIQTSSTTLGASNLSRPINPTPSPSPNALAKASLPLNPSSSLSPKNQSSSSTPSAKNSLSLKRPTIAQSDLTSERNEPRAKLRLSLSIRGLDKSGQYFVEVIQTEDVSKHGICFMLCKHELDLNSIVEIVGFQGKFHAQGEIKHISFNPVDKTYRIGLRLLGEPNNWIVK